MAQKVLVVGGAGYIGSHMVRSLLEAGNEVTVFDNLSTGHRNMVPKKVKFIKGDLNKKVEIYNALSRNPFHAVMHFAASSLVGESVSNPLKYYRNNVSAFVNLLDAMMETKLKRLIFSSTAAVFGEPAEIPLKEDSLKKPTNPYGHSKLMIEQMLKDADAAYGVKHVVLRYFNAAGAHSSGEIGEDHAPESHLIPNLIKAMLGKSKPLTVFGTDYPTPDGTCVRDYIHVEDLCEAHRLALKWLTKEKTSGVFNLGSGTGYSIREIIREAESIAGIKVPVKYGPRRAGDPSSLIATSEKARKILGWKAQRTLRDILETAWRWHKK